jgi:hypothetical protein
MKKSELKTNRLYVWGHSMLNKLSSRARKRRLREASKKRRQQIKKNLRNDIDT